MLELLTTRIGFKAYIETRPVEVYRLTLAKPGTLGPGLQRVDFNCAEIPSSEAPKDRDGKSLCRQGAEFLDVRINTHGSGTISDLIFVLQVMHQERLIVDATGLGR